MDPLKVLRTAVRKIAEETNLIASTDPLHRIEVKGEQDLMVLIQAINTLADLKSPADTAAEGPLQPAASRLQAEKKILAAVISELPEGVVVCNAQGRMLLFNRRVQELLSEQDAQGGAPSRSPPAPGRSISAFIEKSLIEHALEDIKERLHRKVLDAVSHFTMLSKKNHILGCRVIPMLDHLGHFSGFILILNDITADRESDHRQPRI